MGKLIDAMVEEIKEQALNVFSVTEISNGTEQTVRLREDSLCRDTYSVSKAFTMAAAGFLFDEGKLSPDETVGEIFGSLPAGADGHWRDVTVADALRHKTGILAGIDVDSNAVTKIGSDWLGHIFTLPLDGVRGKTYAYDDGVYYLLSRIVSEKTGMTLCDYLRVKLFLPLGFREYAWSTCPLGYSAGGSGLFISCADMAKLGSLWLNNGVWQGKRILSGEWVNLALEQNYAFSQRSQKKRSYYKTGMCGQILYFSYADNLVLAIQAYMPSEHRTRLVDKFIGM